METSTCVNQSVTCDKSTDKNSEKTDKNSASSEITVVNKIPRTPLKPRGRPPTKSNVSSSSSESNNRSRSTSSFRVPTSDHQSQKSTAAPQRSDSTSKRKRIEDDAPNTDVAEKTVSSPGKNTNDTICPTCNRGFDKDDSAVCCECCVRWHHAECQNLSEAEITAFKFLGSKASYFCLNCNAGAKELYRHTLILKERVDNAEKDIANVTAK